MTIINELLASKSSDNDDVTEVLAALGYLIALRNTPAVSRTVPPLVANRILDRLIRIVQEWLVIRQSEKIHQQA